MAQCLPPVTQAIQLHAMSASLVRRLSDSDPDLRRIIGHAPLHAETERFLKFDLGRRRASKQKPSIIVDSSTVQQDTTGRARQLAEFKHSVPAKITVSAEPSAPGEDSYLDSLAALPELVRYVSRASVSVCEVDE